MLLAGNKYPLYYFSFCLNDIGRGRVRPCGRTHACVDGIRNGKKREQAARNREREKERRIAHIRVTN